MLFAAPSFTPRERLLTVIVLANVAITSILLLSSGAAPLSEKLDNRIEGIDISTARYIDLTHAIEPGMPLWGAFAQPIFSAARAAVGMDGFIATGEEFTYAKQGFVATEVTIPTDQIGTQLDVPAHWNDWGATLTDVPATVTLRPLVVVDITDGVRSDPGYHAQVEDVERWEEAHGKVPNGSVVLFRSDWSRGWVEYTRTGKMPDAFPGVSLAALKFLHGERQILVHGHEPLDTDMTPSLEGEAWLMHNNFMQIEGVANLHQVPPKGCLLSIGFAKIAGAAGGLARLVAVCPANSLHGATIAGEPGAPLPQQPYPLQRGDDGVLRPTADAVPTSYCKEGVGSPLGCPLP